MFVSVCLVVLPRSLSLPVYQMTVFIFSLSMILSISLCFLSFPYILVCLCLFFPVCLSLFTSVCLRVCASIFLSKYCLIITLFFSVSFLLVLIGFCSPLCSYRPSLMKLKRENLKFNSSKVFLIKEI